MLGQVEKTVRYAAIRIVGIYVVVSTAWIYGSESVLGMFVSNPATIVRIEMVKGLLFVVVTAVLLFLLIIRQLALAARTERSLQQEARRRRLLFERSRDGIVILDQEGRVIEANQQFADMLGYPVAELLRLYVWDWDRDWTRDELLEMIRQLDAAGRFFDTRQVRKDGVLLDVEVSTNAIEWEGQKLVLCVCRDITARKRSEEMLKKNETLLSTILDATGEGILVVDDRGKVLSANRRFQELWRIPDALFSRGTDDELIAWVLDQVSDPDGFVQKVHCLYGAGEESRDELQFKDGRVYERFSRALSVGERQARLWSFRDITDERTAQRALEHERTFLRTLLNTIPDLVWLKDPGGVYLSCNRTFERLYGVPESDLIGRTDYDFVDAEQADFFRRHDRLAMEAGGPRVNEEWLIFADDGHRALVETIKTPMADAAGNLIGVLGTARDITASSELREARDATVELLRLCNKAGSMRELMQDLLPFLLRLTGCEAVAVRLREGNDYPFFETLGLPERFVDAETRLCAVGQDGESVRDGNGAPVLECLCGSTLNALFHPAVSATTSYGSFWTVNFPDTLTGLDPASLQVPIRGGCGKEGFTSLALIPLKMHGETYGLVQFFDKRPGRFDSRKITLLEELSGYVAIAVAKLSADEALQESSLFSRQIIDSAGEGIIVYGSDMRYQLWNPYMEQMSGVPAAEVLGRHPLELVERFPFLKNAALIARLEAALAGKPLPSVEFRYHDVPSGRAGWNADTCTPLRNTKGEVIGVIGLVRDITDQKLAQVELVKLNEELEERVRQRTLEYEEANRELESFSYSVSHDMRAPLRHIEGFTRIFMEDHGDEISAQGKVYLERICNSTKRMGQIIDALLNLSRISRRIICLEEVDLDGIVREIAAELAAAAPERAVEFVVAEGVTAHGDKQMFRVILDNLIGNAWKYTSRQEAARIEFGVEAKRGTKTFHVRDNGAGFDATYANKLFGVFQRLHRAEEYEGTGVGLATVQRLVHRLGGRIWAEGEVDRGATFYFTIGE